MASLKDYAHGQRLFGANQNRLSPKFSFLYHVFFDLNPAANLKTMYSPGSDWVKEVGMLVKSVDLPKFDIQTKELNAYNQNITVQTGMKYLPITVQFHDDSADVVKGFWEDYMTFYYGDAYNDLNTAVQMRKNRYSIPVSQNWGYLPRENVNYLNSVEIYSMSMDRYSQYTLINPTIDTWNHGTHLAGQNEFIGHTMTLRYEYVRYSEGDIGTSPNTAIKGFGGIHYDSTPGNMSQSWAPSGGNGQSNITRYGPNQAEPQAQTLEDRLKKTVYRPGQATINDTVNKAANAARNFNINTTIANASLPPALGNILSQGAAGLSNGNFPSPNK
jgi:hypothetical protein